MPIYCHGKQSFGFYDNCGVSMFIFFGCIGRGGASIYGKEFEDEFHQELKHVGK